MTREHVISDELIEQAQFAFSKHTHWIAYNTINYFLGDGDMYFFKTSDEAHEFSYNNISEYDNFRVIYAYSVDELLKQVPYGERLEKRLADPDANGLYNKDGNAFTDALIEHMEQQQILNNKKISIMIEKNLEYLKSNVRNHGFGDDLGAEIEAQLKKGASEFTIIHKTEVNKHEMESTLYFGKSDKSDLYFFNKYDTRLNNEKDETMAQTFYINHGWGVTLKEAYNLLNGRAIEKELVRKLTPEESIKFKEEMKLPPEKKGLPENWEKAPTYKAWIQLDFAAKDKHGNYERKQYHENYGYDLKEALSYYPIKEMMNANDEKSLLRSLQRGNVQMVTVQAPGGDVRVFIEANPQYKSINVYDNKMTRLGQEKREELMKKPEVKEDKGKDQTKEKDLASEQQVEKKPNKGKGNEKVNGEDNGLVKKTRSRSNGKGMGV